MCSCKHLWISLCFSVKPSYFPRKHDAKVNDSNFSPRRKQKKRVFLRCFWMWHFSPYLVFISWVSYITLSVFCICYWQRNLAVKASLRILSISKAKPFLRNKWRNRRKRKHWIHFNVVSGVNIIGNCDCR